MAEDKNNEFEDISLDDDDSSKAPPKKPKEPEASSFLKIKKLISPEDNEIKAQLKNIERNTYDRRLVEDTVENIVETKSIQSKTESKPLPVSSDAPLKSDTLDQSDTQILIDLKIVSQNPGSELPQQLTHLVNGDKINANSAQFLQGWCTLNSRIMPPSNLDNLSNDSKAAWERLENLPVGRVAEAVRSQLPAPAATKAAAPEQAQESEPTQAETQKSTPSVSATASKSTGVSSILSFECIKATVNQWVSNLKNLLGFSKGQDNSNIFGAASKSLTTGENSTTHEAQPPAFNKTS